MEKAKWIMLPLPQGLELCIKWRFGITDLFDSKKKLDYVKGMWLLHNIFESRHKQTWHFG